jgi:hypothetical protein
VENVNKELTKKPYVPGTKDSNSKIFRSVMGDDNYLDQLVNSFGPLARIDPTARDRQFGICPVPLYDFLEEDFELLRTEAGIEEIQSILRKYDLLRAQPKKIGLPHRAITS